MCNVAAAAAGVVVAVAAVIMQFGSIRKGADCRIVVFCLSRGQRA